MTMPDQTVPAMPGVVNAASVGEKRPGINRMGVGRTVAIKPIRKEMVNKSDGKGNIKVVRRIIADVIVLDGQPVTYGGNLVRLEPDTLAQPVPFVVRSLWIDEAALGNQLEPWAGSGNYVVGHLIKLPPQGDNHPAWAITTEPTPEENAMFARFWSVAQGRPDSFVNPAPYSIVPAVAPAQQQAAPLPAQPAPAAPAPALDVAAMIAAAQSASAAPAGPPAGSGITAEAWAALPPEQQQAITAHFAGQARPTGF